MPRFRDPSPSAKKKETASPPMSLENVRSLIGETLWPAHFFVANKLTLEWRPPGSETIPWELFHGRLLDSSQTTARQTFEAWNIHVIEESGRSAEPILSVRLDAAAGQLHVTRAVYCYAWEGYHAGDNVYLSRETRKWVRELVGTLHLAHFRDVDELRDELICRLFQAVVGTSRLPLTSVEAPLPAFSLGQLAYFYRADLDATEAKAAPLRSYQELLQRSLTDKLSWLEKTTLLETLLHAIPWEELPQAADRLMARWRLLSLVFERPFVGDVSDLTRLAVSSTITIIEGLRCESLLHLLRNVFNEASLSPYTDLVDKTIALVLLLREKGYLDAAQVVDFLSYLLRQIGRHLTAYDLVTFHHRGANYPDALLLDAILKAYLGVIEGEPPLFLDAPGDTDAERKRKRLRRRALRQGWLLRRHYEEHRVPDAPTSQGENARVLPLPHARIPEEQILNPSRRTKRLYAADPLTLHLRERGREVLRQSIKDLRHPNELRELGMALFLDRPLGVGKAPGEPDQTLLLSYEAFSRSIADGRLQVLADTVGFDDRAEYESCRQRLHAELPIKGLPAATLAEPARPSIVSLADACKVAEDFVVLRTTSKTAADFFRQFPLAPLAKRFAVDDVNGWRTPLLIVRSTSATSPSPGLLTIYDEELRPRIELEIDASRGYRGRGGVEYPVAGLRVVRIWERVGPAGELRKLDLHATPVALPPRDD